MALFSNDTKKIVTKTLPTGKAGAKPAKVSAFKPAPEDGRLEHILKAPWLSEKALIGTEHGVYVFAVPARATKTQVIAAVELIYKVKPRQVRMVNLPAKKTNLKTRRGEGSRARRHKAYVYLKKGETIQFA
jgi:large subunit ribosomal protein L23